MDKETNEFVDAVMVAKETALDNWAFLFDIERKKFMESDESLRKRVLKKAKEYWEILSNNAKNKD